MKGAKPNPVGKNVIPMKGAAPVRVPDAPDYMTERARRIWEELAGHLASLGRLDPAYVHQFASYCESVSNFIDATHSLACEGLYYTVKTRNGMQQKKTAAFGLQQEAMNQMRRDAALFGLSPVDAARLKITGQGDLFDDIVKQLRNGPA